jgi:hypothetical protein
MWLLDKLGVRPVLATVLLSQWPANLTVVPGLQDQGGLTTDYEFLSTYTRVSADRVRATQREVYYGESRGVLGGLTAREPEAVFEYVLDFVRAPPPPDAAGASSCVTTPKGFTQCS